MHQMNHSSQFSVIQWKQVGDESSQKRASKYCDSFVNDVEPGLNSKCISSDLHPSKVI